MTYSTTGLRKGLCYGESPCTLTRLWGARESWNMLGPLPPQSRELPPSQMLPSYPMGQAETGTKGLWLRVCIGIRGI